MKPFPLVVARSPPPARAGFRRRLGLPAPPATPDDPKPLAEWQLRRPKGPGGSRVRAWYAPGSRLHPLHKPFYDLSPYEGPELRVLRSAHEADGLQAAWLREEWESHPPLSRLAVVRPVHLFPDGSTPLQFPSGACALADASAPPRPARVTTLFFRAVPRGGLSPPFPRPSHRGFTRRDPPL